MKIFAFIPLLFSACLYAQSSDVILSTSNDIIDVVTQDELQSNMEIVQESSKLEDLYNDHQCLEFTCSEEEFKDCEEQFKTHESCQGFANSLVPQGYKDKGWKSLFEIKYQPIETREVRSLGEANFNEVNLSRFYRDNPKVELNTYEDLEAQTKKLQADLQAHGSDLAEDYNNLRTNLIIDQLTDPNFTKDDADMMNKIKNYSKGMNDQEFLQFVSAVAGYVDYNDERALFKQTEEGGKGVVTPFMQMMGTKYGVCGDIHSMAAKIGEQRGWETFTVGYALEGMQHVVTAMVNPNDPNNLMIVNYGTYEEQALNDGNSITPTPSGTGWEEIGTQLRIFKNDKTGNPTGQMQQIATIPTALGSFMNGLFKKDYQASKAMPSNENYRKEVATGITTKHTTKMKKDGDKIVDKMVSEGLMIYEGETENAKIYGIAISHDKYKDIYRWSKKENKCVLKKNKYFSVGMAGSLIDLTQAQLDDTFYVYLNMKGGQIFHLYQSDFFQFKGIIGYELEGFASTYDGYFLTADGNLSTFFGAVADYQKKGLNIHVGVNLETNAALRNQNLMTDLSTIPKNVNPIAFNAVSMDANASYQIDPKNTLFTNNNLTLTRVGGRVFLSTGIIHNNTSIMLSYQGGIKALNIGNSLQNINLLQNFNNMDGFRISASQSFSNRSGTISGSIGGYGGISTSTPTLMPMGGATLKVNFGGGQKRKPKR